MREIARAKDLAREKFGVEIADAEWISEFARRQMAARGKQRNDSGAAMEAEIEESGMAQGGSNSATKADLHPGEERKKCIDAFASDIYGQASAVYRLKESLQKGVSVASGQLDLIRRLPEGLRLDRTSPKLEECRRALQDLKALLPEVASTPKKDKQWQAVLGDL